MENKDKKARLQALRTFLEAAKTSDQRITTLGEVPLQKMAIVAFWARGGRIQTMEVMPICKCKIDGKAGVLVANGPEDSLTLHFLADRLCLVSV